MSGVTYVFVAESPGCVCPKICLHCKQLIILHDRSDLSNLPHLEVEVTNG